MAKILLVEDDDTLKEILKFNLSRENHSVFDTDNANEALIYMEELIPDLILLDLMLPGLKGEEFLKIIRSNKDTENIPVIIISAKNSEDSIVKLLKTGADDYLTKPFSIKVLLSKIDVHLKKKKADGSILSYGNVTVDLRKHKVSVNGQDVELTHTEFELLGFMIKHPQIVFTRNQFLSNIWGYESDIYTRTVDSHISSLRKKLKSADFKIKSVPKVGYKIE